MFGMMKKLCFGSKQHSKKKENGNINWFQLDKNLKNLLLALDLRFNMGKRAAE